MKTITEVIFLTMIICIGLNAQNPIIQTMYTGDPAPVIYNDTLFLYVGHDEDKNPVNSFLMREYSLFTTTDMVNWTAHKTPLKTSDFKWSAGDASASQCIERNGKYYWYVSSLNKTSPGVSVGVAVSDSPYGPFKDALDKALITNNMTTFGKHSWDDLDPTVMINDDGQAYLYWGNNACYWAKLNEDMISLASPITALDIFDKSAFGPDFEEAPWVYKKNKTYYMVYASNVVESIHYTTSKSLEGPWNYGGLIMPHMGKSGSNHPGIIDYKGHSYFFYHNAALPYGGDFNRSVCIEEFKYNPDGSIPEMTMTTGITKGVGTLNPFKRTEAETIAWSEGLKLDENDNGVFVTSIHNNDYIKVRNVDFGNNGVSKFEASVSSRYFGGEIEIHIDSLTDKLIGTLKIPYIGDWNDWELLSTEIKNIKGIHDLYFVFKGREPHVLFNFDYWKFYK
jgi:arabinoxylan arabinofuranohydrolase